MIKTLSINPKMTINSQGKFFSAGCDVSLELERNKDESDSDYVRRTAEKALLVQKNMLQSLAEEGGVPLEVFKPFK